MVSLTVGQLGQGQESEGGQVRWSEQMFDDKMMQLILGATILWRHSWWKPRTQTGKVPETELRS